MGKAIMRAGVRVVFLEKVVFPCATFLRRQGHFGRQGRRSIEERPFRLIPCLRRKKNVHDGPMAHYLFHHALVTMETSFAA